MTRAVLLALAERPWVRDFMLKFRAGRRAVDRFVAGETLKEAIPAIRQLHDSGLMITLDVLGENVAEQSDARRAVDAYKATIDGIRAAGIPSRISLKLTQLGLDLGRDRCRKNLVEVVRHAEAQGMFVRIDMEASAYTQRTLDIFSSLRDDHPRLGVVIQSCLRRSERDVLRLTERAVDIRLCKGAYKEPPEVAFPRKADVDASYRRLLDILFDPAALGRGVYPAVATHDEKLIRYVREKVRDGRVPAEKYEFQMLYGVRRDLQRELVEAGHRVRIYVPFGSEWYAYFMRRLAERPANVTFILRALFKG